MATVEPILIVKVLDTSGSATEVAWNVTEAVELGVTGVAYGTIGGGTYVPALASVNLPQLEVAGFVTGGFVTENFVESVTDVAVNVTVAGATGFDWEA